MKEEIMDPETFDLSDMFTGVDFPTEEVPVFLNERVAYDLSKVEEEIAKSPDDEKLEKKRKALVKEASKSCFTFHLEGIPSSNLQNALDEIEKIRPQEFTTFGRPKPDPERNEMTLDAIWVLFIKKIVSPDGKVATVETTEDARSLRKGVPFEVSEKVTAAINELRERVAKGFESLAMETDFLSKR